MSTDTKGQSRFGTIITTGGSGNLPATNELPVDMHKKLMSSLVDLTPLTSIMTRLEEDTAHNFRIDWQEEREVPHLVTIATTEASASTTIVVTDHGTSLVIGTLLYNPRVNDLRRVSAAPTTNSITVAIDQGGYTSAVWNANDVVHVLPTTVPENDDLTYRVASAQDENFFNYEQLIRHQYSITRVMDKHTTWFGGPGSKRDQLKRQKFREVRIKMEKAIYFGGRATTGTSPADIRLMGGINFKLRSGTLFKDFNGIFTESGFDDYLLGYHEENPDMKQITAFVAPNVISKISQFAKDKVRMKVADKTMGLWVTEYIGPVRTTLVSLPLLADNETRGWGFLLDLESLRLKFLDRLMFYPEAKNIGESEQIIDTYRVVMSLMIANESRHSMFIGADL